MIMTDKNNEKIWLSTPTMHGEELTYMQEAYHTNWMSTVGENITAVETRVSELVDCRHGVALSCGTAALHLAVKLAGIREGDRVFCSDMTFAATVNPVAYEKAVPVFIDTEYDTWNMDPVALEAAFARYPDTKAVMLADLYGTPAKMDAIRALCDRYGALLIEDAAESLGATYKGDACGTFGDYNAISFNGNKIITGSSGGMLLTNDGDAAETARRWSTQSRQPAPWYQHEELGYNYRMSNVIAGVVRGQLPYLGDHIARKKAIYERYRDGFADLPVQMNPFDPASMEPNYWLSCMIIDPDAMAPQTRSDHTATYTKQPGKSCPTEILEALAAENIEGRPIWKPLHLQPIFRQYEFITAGTTDVGADIFERGLCLPSDIKMTEEQQQRVIRIVRRCFGK